MRTPAEIQQMFEEMGLGTARERARFEFSYRRNENEVEESDSVYGQDEKIGGDEESKSAELE